MKNKGAASPLQADLYIEEQEHDKCSRKQEGTFL